MPHFSIEAEGGTNPLDATTVYATLAQACNYSGAQALQVATEQLSNWQTQPGFYSALQDVYTNLSYDETIRYQAVIQLKNGIDKHWRKGSNNAISKEEKLKIKTAAIVAGLQEPSPSLSLHNALLIGKIVRSEFPHDWPDIMSKLIALLRRATGESATLLYTGNVLTITLHVIKELATGGLQRTKKSLQSVAPEMLQVLVSLLDHLINAWLGPFSGPETDPVISKFAARTRGENANARQHENFAKEGQNSLWALGQNSLWALGQNSLRALKTIRRLIIFDF